MLKDVQVIRPLAVLLIIIGHAFIIFCGDVPSWPHTPGFEPVKLYSWIYQVASSFHLQAFVFIAGYVFSYQTFTKKKVDPFNLFVAKKAKRLLIPSLLFSAIYYWIFFGAEEASTIKIAYSIINGSGHMWFLPMLFWVYIFGRLITQKSYESLYILSFFGAVSIVSVLIPDHLRISSAFSYLFYFILGTEFYKYKKTIEFFLKPKYVFITIMSFCIIFVCEKILQTRFAYIQEGGLVYKAGFILMGRFLQLCYVFFALSFIYLITNFYLTKSDSKLPDWIVRANSYCYGIYIYQQFILKLLYYKSDLPFLTGILLLPFIALIITLVTSFILTHLTLKFRIGKFLMG